MNRKEKRYRENNPPELPELLMRTSRIYRNLQTMLENIEGGYAANSVEFMGRGVSAQCFLLDRINDIRELRKWVKDSGPMLSKKAFWIKLRVLEAGHNELLRAMKHHHKKNG